jgi:hypothetical protein
MQIDPSVLAASVSAATAIIVLLVGKFVTSRTEKAEASSSEGDAAKALSEAAKTQINTYNQEIIIPMRQRLSEMEHLVSSNQVRIQDIEGKHSILQVKYDNLLKEYETYKIEMTIQVSQLRKIVNDKDIEIANLQSQIDKLMGRKTGKQMGDR